MEEAGIPDFYFHLNYAYYIFYAKIIIGFTKVSPKLLLELIVVFHSNFLN